MKTPSNAPTCINLRETFPGFRIFWDECDDGHRDPWSMELVGKYGKGYPYGGDRLGGIIFDHPKQRTKLFAIVGSPYAPGKTWQKGDEVAFTFGLEHAREVFRILGLRRKRKATPATFAALALANAARIAPKSRRSESGAPERQNSPRTGETPGLAGKPAFGGANHANAGGAK